MHRRLGWSRVEVLLVLFIVVLLAGLGIAAVVRLREFADLTKCRNNLKEFGLAVHNYDLTNGRLPPLTDQGDGAPSGRGLPSVFANLIPFVEQTCEFFRPEQTPDYYHAHSTILFTSPCRGTLYHQHGGMANGSWRFFLDPSDTTAHQLKDVPMTLPDGTTGYYAAGSYAANGAAPWGTGAIARSFPRGTENTVLFGERPQVCRTATGDEVYNLWGVGFYSPHMPAFACLTPTGPLGLWSTDQVAPVEPLPDEYAADRDLQIRFRLGRRDAVPELPDFRVPMQRVRVREGQACDPRLPGSPHRTGMQMSMADGGVRVFGWDTTPWVFWAAVTTGNPGD